MPKAVSSAESLLPNNWQKITNIIAGKKCLSGFSNTMRSYKVAPTCAVCDAGGMYTNGTAVYLHNVFLGNSSLQLLESTCSYRAMPYSCMNLKDQLLFN